jgi:hypothetical protein
MEPNGFKYLAPHPRAIGKQRHAGAARGGPDDDHHVYQELGRTILNTVPVAPDGPRTFGAITLTLAVWS